MSSSPVSSSHGAVLVFDGDCGFCTTSANWAQRGFRAGERAEPWQFVGAEFLVRHRLSEDDVRRRAWWVDDSGRRDGGHRAVGRALIARGGLWRLVGGSAMVPPTSWLAALVYTVVSRYRYRLPGGTPACRVDRGSTKG